MELRTLAYVEAVARLGSFTRAAREVRVAQPAVSAQIAGLERELGVRLFNRARKQVTLTDAGTRVVARARRMLAEADQIRADVDDLRGLLTGRLRLGITLLLGGLDLPGAVAAFHRAHPGLTLQVKSDLIDPLVAELESGELDVVVGPIHDHFRDRLDCEVLVEETLVLISPPDLAPRTLADAADLPFVCLRSGSGLRAILDRAATELGFVPNVTVEVATAWQIREFVAAGLGVALLAASVAYAEGPGIRISRLDPAPPHPPLGVLRRLGDESRAAQAIVAYLREAAG